MRTDNSNEQQQAAVAYLCPTSPWTEPYQNAPAQEMQRCAFDSEDQRPTQHALSDIYNRGYE